MGYRVRVEEESRISFLFAGMADSVVADAAAAAAAVLLRLLVTISLVVTARTQRRLLC